MIKCLVVQNKRFIQKKNCDCITYYKMHLFIQQQLPLLKNRSYFKNHETTNETKCLQYPPQKTAEYLTYLCHYVFSCDIVLEVKLLGHLGQGMQLNGRLCLFARTYLISNTANNNSNFHWSKGRHIYMCVCIVFS